MAVKIISDGLQHTQKLTEFLNSYTTSVKGYRMIRKEVLFLSTLRHHNLTKLCGVSTHPFMLLMELAPLGSLGSILKQYRAANQVLTPAILQASMYQVSNKLTGLVLYQRFDLTCNIYLLLRSHQQWLSYMGSMWYILI